MDSPSSKGKIGALELQKVQSSHQQTLNVVTAVGHCVTCMCSDICEWANCTFVTWCVTCVVMVYHMYVWV